MRHAASRPAPGRSFDSKARHALVAVAYRFPVELAYVVDHAGDEIVGFVPVGDDVHGFAIAYPVQDGFGAADEQSRVLGVFGTLEELCSALTKHLLAVCAPQTLH